MEADDIDLIARIYDAALEPQAWPALLARIAYKIGAAGAFLFEVQREDDSEHVVTRMFSENYDPVVVRDFLSRFNHLELRDQGRFAELSAMTDPVELVSDIYIHNSVAMLLEQENTRFMMRHGLKHRAGALLNKDFLTVDRFALQFGVDHGPITDAEKRKAMVFLPHVAKSIGLSRPLEERLRLQDAFEALLGAAGQGIAILDHRGHVIYKNAELDRVLDVHPVFRLTAGKTLEVNDAGQSGRYQAMLADDGAHGRFGARARKEALVVNLQKPGTALFIEICPAETNAAMGRLGRGCRLLTVLDTSRPLTVNLDRICSFFALSKAEASVLELIAAGHSNQEIADLRHRSLDTVKSQIRSLMQKTNSTSRTELVQMAGSLSSGIRYFS